MKYHGRWQHPDVTEEAVPPGCKLYFRPPPTMSDYSEWRAGAKGRIASSPHARRNTLNGSRVKDLIERGCTITIIGRHAKDYPAVNRRADGEKTGRLGLYKAMEKLSDSQGGD